MNLALKLYCQNYQLVTLQHSGLLIGTISCLINFIFLFFLSDMFCAGRVPDEDLQRVIGACGGSVLTTVSQIDKFVLGSCAEFYEKQVGSERYFYLFKKNIYTYKIFN